MEFQIVLETQLADAVIQVGFLQHEYGCHVWRCFFLIALSYVAVIFNDIPIMMFRSIYVMQLRLALPVLSFRH